MVDGVPVMIAYWDRDLRNVVANAAYLDWFGSSPRAMSGHHISEVLGAELYAADLSFIRGALRGEEQLYERTIVDRAGRTRHTQASYVPDVDAGEVRGFFALVTEVPPRGEAQASSMIARTRSERAVVSDGQSVAGADGQIADLEGTLQDLAETNEFARELAHDNADLRQVNELNRDVIAMLGHDVRSSLGAVSNFLDLLDQDGARLSADESRICLSRARLATASLMTLVDHILAEASTDSGALEPVRERVDLSSLIEAAVQAPGLDGAVWVRPHGPPVIASFDRVHLMQILDNLLTNACRYGRQPIRISLDRAAGQVTISVTDAGDGVPAELEGRLFTKFVKSGTAQASSGGAGFGLYMSHKLAEANGGTLSYHPAQHGQAHAFTLTIPMTDETAVCVDATKPSYLAVTKTSTGHRVTR